MIQHFKKYVWKSETRIYEKTLYNYIEAGDIPAVSVQDFLYAGKRCRPHLAPKRYSIVANAARSITKKPKEANIGDSITIHYDIDRIAVDGRLGVNKREYGVGL